MIYTPGTTSGHNLKISRDKGATWELQNCSYAPNGKIIIGGTNNNELQLLVVQMKIMKVIY